MKDFIKKLMQHKITKSFAILLAIIVVAIAYHSINGIYENIQNAKELDEAPPYFPDYPPLNTTGKDVNLIKKGEYLVKAGDCIACHTNTPEKGPVFAGGLPMPTPFGTIYAPNITPDKETGIGNWTLAQFVKAMHEGISPEGHYYYPAFPYLFFNKMSSDDLIAIKAYLDSIPPVKQANRPNEMVFPFNWRFLQLGWRVMFFYKSSRESFQYQKDRSSEWNRGAYLTQTLGHCAMCHSPSYSITKNIPLGAPIQEYSFTGAKVGAFLAPNITSSNLGNASIDEIVDVFLKDQMIGGGKVDGPMLEVNHDSLRYLSKEDLKAIATYLKSIHSKTPPKPKGNVGKGVYDTYCSGCHASGGGGAPQFGNPAAWDPILKQGINKVYTNAIQGIGGMPAKGTCFSCTDDDIKQAVDYMVEATKKPVEPPVITAPTPDSGIFNLEKAKAIYEANCAACHRSGLNGAPILGKKDEWNAVIDQGFLQTYVNVDTGKGGHPTHGGCPHCTDEELKSAIQYMLQESTSKYNYSLW